MSGRNQGTSDKKAMYSMLFRAAFHTLKTFAEDPKWLGAEAGGMAVLHTRGQNLSFHPHLHILMPSGGLSDDKREWMKMHPRFFAPVAALSAVFRASFLRLLNRERKQAGFNAPKATDKLIEEARKKSWVVYAQRPFSSPDKVIDYLANYTHRVALSNTRIVKLEAGKALLSEGSRESCVRI